MKTAENEKFDREYYRQYFRKNLFGQMSGERGYLYSYWVRYLKRHLAPGSRILDLGCGVGFFARRLSEHFGVTGAEISAAAIEEGKRIAPAVDFVHLSKGPLPFEPASFEAVSAFDVLEHQDRPEAMLQEILRVLKPGGLLVASMPNPASLGARVRGSEWYALQDKTHVSLFQPDRWRQLLREAGFEVTRSGTDFLWDVPYTRRIPKSLQKLALVSLQWGLVYSCGFLPWLQGETFSLVARKPGAEHRD